MKLYLWARKIHRFLAIIIVVLSLIMGSTGMVMKYPFLSGTFSFINPDAARTLHNNLSSYFAIVLFLMAITGLIMFLQPYLLKWKKKE